MPELIWFIRVAEVLTLVLGGTIMLQAYRGYKRSRNRVLLLSALGFSLLILGSFIEGIMYEFMGYELLLGHAARAVLTTLGFLTLLLAIRRVR